MHAWVSTILRQPLMCLLAVFHTVAQLRLYLLWFALCARACVCVCVCVCCGYSWTPPRLPSQCIFTSHVLPFLSSVANYNELSMY